ncbi:MAG: TIGR00282 family metallophosphoesterase [Magnetococcales bacterium]|nr:TIGR00282 family metallophosphoesterase [Magnetococcales bacterium]MBF0584944.1 TIGR00282 family metallophosphoesterase [Magnetococcales bacterium]
MTILFVGDLFGKSGRRALDIHLDRLKRVYALDMVIANGENSAGGIGITPGVATELFQGGVDVITTGNHIWKYKEIFDYIDNNNRLLRPMNYPPGAPGKGFVVFNTPSKMRVAVLNLSGRVFMEPLDCPFQLADRFLERVRLGRDVDAIMVDMHAEASSEKGAMGHYLDGRVSAVLGSHTHIPTADHQILPKGTAFQTDVGMTGCYNSVIGMKTETVMPRFLRQMPTHFEQMQGEGTLCGTIVSLNKGNGLCQQIIPIRLGGQLSNTGL